MIESFLLVLWLLWDNAELIAAACLLGVAACAWAMAGAVGLFVTWFFN